MPTSWIRKLNMQTRPICPLLGAYHIAADRSDHGHDNLWPQAPKDSAKARFAGTANAPARPAGHLVDGLATQIHQITTQGAKGFEELVVAQSGKGGNNVSLTAR